MLLVNSVQYDNGVNAQQFHNRIGIAYDLPIISMKDSIYQPIESNQIKVEQITPDNLHPNDIGHKMMAKLMTTFLERIEQKKEIRQAYSIPEQPITKNGYEDAIRYQNTTITPTMQGFYSDREKQNGICDVFKHSWRASKIGSNIKFLVIGGNIAIQYRKSVQKPAPVAIVTIDENRE